MTLIAVWMVFRESRILSQKSDNEVKRRGMLGFAFKAELQLDLLASSPSSIENTCYSLHLKFVKHTSRLTSL